MTQPITSCALSPVSEWKEEATPAQSAAPNMLASADRAAAQGWLDKVAAREAALAASRQFAGDFMAALANPAQ
jgi:hypothetical protein